MHELFAPRKVKPRTGFFYRISAEMRCAKFAICGGIVFIKPIARIADKKKFLKKLLVMINNSKDLMRFFERINGFGLRVNVNWLIHFETIAG